MSAPIADRERTELRELMVHLYEWRAWWVDIPGFLLCAFKHLEFYSHGTLFKVPKPFDEFVWVLLVAYLVIKQGVRFQGKITSRRGYVWVIMWWGAFLEMVIVQGFHPAGQFLLPNQMFETTLIVIGAFLGLLPIKRWFYRRYPILAGLLVPHDSGRRR